MEKYLEDRYFRRFSSATFVGIFKSLWRVTFKSTTAECKANRGANTQVLGIVFARHRVELTNIISTERDWFSDVTFAEETLRAMATFFHVYPRVFPLLTDAAKIQIQSFSDSSLDNFSICWFVSENLDSHMDEVIRRIDEREILFCDSFTQLCTSLSTSEVIEKVYHAGIKLYCQSDSYDTADMRFQETIKPYIESFSKEHFEAFLSGCETCYNDQAVSRHRAFSDHRELKKALDKRFPGIDLEQYPAFKGSVE